MAGTLTPKKTAAILAAVTAGEPVRRVLRKHNVSSWKWYTALDADEALAERYARAKTAGLDRWAEEMIEIADESRIGEKRKTTRIRVDTGDTLTRCGCSPEQKAAADWHGLSGAACPNPAAIEDKSVPLDEVTTGDMVERSKLMIDTRKWLLAKLMPKKYGDRTVLAGDPDAPIKTEAVTVDLNSLSIEERRAYLELHKKLHDGAKRDPIQT